MEGLIRSRSSCCDVIIGDVIIGEDTDNEGDGISGEYDVIGEVGVWQSEELK